MFRVFKRATQLGVISSTLYIGGIYVATDHPKYQKYIPFSNKVIDFLEEREFRKISYERSLLQEITNVSKSALNSTSSGTSLTSEIQSENQKLAKTEISTAATSAKSSKDPLLPKRFFNAISGTVGEEDKDYLPLVLLPDDHDEILNKAAMSLNDLISSYNASAITEETVLSVSENLANVAKNNGILAPHYSQLIMQKSENFKKLYQQYRLIWEEYLNTQEQIKGHEISLQSNPVFADYNHRMAEEINDTELLLVRFINAGKNGMDLDVMDPEYKRFLKSKPQSPPKLSYSIAKPTYKTSELSNDTKYDSSYGGFDGTEVKLRVQLALTLLVSALQKDNTPVASYIQGLRDAVSTYPDDASRENVINEALKAIEVPKSINLQPILHDIIFYDRHF